MPIHNVFQTRLKLTKTNTPSWQPKPHTDVEKIQDKVFCSQQVKGQILVQRQGINTAVAEGTRTRRGLRRRVKQWASGKTNRSHTHTHTHHRQFYVSYLLRLFHLRASSWNEKKLQKVLISLHQVRGLVKRLNFKSHWFFFFFCFDI